MLTLQNKGGKVNISSISSKSGKVGDKITIKGSGLNTGPAMSAGPGSVTFNGVKAEVTKWTAEEVETVVPQGAVSGPLSIAFAGNAVEVQFLVTPALANEPMEEKEKSDQAEAAMKAGKTVADQKSEDDKGGKTIAAPSNQPKS